MKNKKDIMCVYPRYNKRNELSFEMHCSGKDAYTKKYKVYIKTVKVPLELKGKKEIEDFSLKCQLEWKKEVERKSKGLLCYEDNKISFSEYATKWVERIIIYNKEAYSHYARSLSNLKVLKQHFGLLTLNEMTQPVIQNFCDWLCTRTYKQEAIIVKQSLRPILKERKIRIKDIASGCNLNAETVKHALTVGKHIAKDTAKKMCDYLNVSLPTYYNVICEDKLYSKTANKGLKVLLHSILGQAVKDKLIPINYASSEYTRKITGTVSKKDIYETQEEIQEFLNCVNKEEDIRKRVAFSLGLSLGLRGAEISGLAWQDINFDKGTISINKNTLYVDGFGIITKGTKNKSSTRTINMPSSLIELLKEYRGWWLKEQKNHGDLWVNTDKLFVQNNGNDMSNSTIAIWLKRFQIENNLKRVTLHGLRHTNITMLIINGVDIKTVSARVGHSDIQTTLNIYSHYTSQSDKKACDMIENLLYAQKQAI